VVSDGSSVRRDLPLNFFMDRYTESYAVEMAAFVDAVVNDRPVPVSGRDARYPLVMGLAAGKSYREGRPIKLSEIG
jgi:myo-inositol 2-dehydrogenase/D-chiro-inositol 1-dehydrogenase